ncbi:UNVERIFIED_CONTAM: hypothetical protein PYX00_002279 [Menopon gallinae]|uniref:Gamma-secretase subunit PEN-2 n=1 Tax=Menopon gallinae TaxID=328185 RepID=A0AAW2IHI2_9NEOP
MDLTKLKDDKKLELCRWYFRAGFAFLPFLWCVNAVWFFREAFKRPPYEEQQQIKRYVVSSIIGCIIWLVIIISWTVIFQTKRAEWGEFADTISFVIPTGRP